MMKYAVLCWAIVVAAGCGSISRAQHQTVTQNLEACQATRSSLEAENLRLREEVEQPSQSADEPDEVHQKLTDVLRRELDARLVRLDAQGGLLVLALRTSHLFDGARAQVTQPGAETLQRIARVLATADDRRFIILARRDDPSGPQDSGEVARGEAVVDVLVGEGVEARELAVAGFAGEKAESVMDTQILILPQP